MELVHPGWNESVGVVVSPEVVARDARRGVLDERIGVLAAQIHALEAELVGVVGEFDSLDGWQGDGLRSLGQWLSIRAKFANADANRIARVAGRLDRVPTLMGAAREGRVSLGVLDAAARVSTPENESAVASVALQCTPAQLAKVLSSYRDLKPKPEPDEADEVDGPEPGWGPEFWWRTWTDHEGRGRVDAALDATAFALLESAWAAATASWRKDRRLAGEHDGPAAPGGGRTDTNAIAEHVASAMLDRANAEGGVRDAAGEKFLVQLHLDVETMAEILGLEFNSTLPFRLGSECFLPDSGRHLSHAEAARFLCEGKVQVLVHHQGVPLWLSNETRAFTRHQKRAMRFRSGGKGGCEFPGCTHDRHLDGHHVRFHAEGEPTTLDNGVFLCAYHHRLLHSEHWDVTINADQTYTFWTHGRCLGTTTRRTRPGGRAPDLMRLPGLTEPAVPDGIDADTATSGTRGERMTPYALDVFLEALLTAGQPPHPCAA